MNPVLHHKVLLVFRHAGYGFLSSLPSFSSLQCIFSSGTVVIYILWFVLQHLVMALSVKECIFNVFYSVLYK